mmetsp:Transcript_10298/g.31490  ORF Transcript_10298/g.31490 Transcript_10298/m.31490 type:complete len:640 (+) Transcript_10298:81-2000(+)
MRFGGGLGGHGTELASEIEQYVRKPLLDGNWEVRMRALQRFQMLLKCAKDDERMAAALAREMPKVHSVLCDQLRDRRQRTALVHETCKTIESLSDVARHSFGPLLGFQAVLELAKAASATTNLPVVEMCGDTIRNILYNTKLPTRAIELVAKCALQESASQKWPLWVADLIAVILDIVPRKKLELCAATISLAIKEGLASSDSFTRIRSERNVVLLELIFPQQASEIFQNAEYGDRFAPAKRPSLEQCCPTRSTRCVQYVVQDEVLKNACKSPAVRSYGSIRSRLSVSPATLVPSRQENGERERLFLLSSPVEHRDWMAKVQSIQRVESALLSRSDSDVQTVQMALSHLSEYLNDAHAKVLITTMNSLANVLHTNNVVEEMTSRASILTGRIVAKCAHSSSTVQIAARNFLNHLQKYAGKQAYAHHMVKILNKAVSNKLGSEMNSERFFVAALDVLRSTACDEESVVTISDGGVLPMLLEDLASLSRARSAQLRASACSIIFRLSQYVSRERFEAVIGTFGVRDRYVLVANASWTSDKVTECEVRNLKPDIVTSSELLEREFHGALNTSVDENADGNIMCREDFVINGFGFESSVKVGSVLEGEDSSDFPCDLSATISDCLQGDNVANEMSTSVQDICL